MNVPALLVAQSVPLAGLLITRSEGEFADVFTIGYFVATGLLLSFAALLDDAYGLSDWFGLAVEALAQ
ncbi:MAG TPA: hypothetical protein VGC68_11120 [Enterovirga sp.]|jgi:hypothetical protein